MASKWRVTIHLQGGGSAVVEAQDVKMLVDEVTGKITQFELVNSEGPRLAFVDLADISAVVIEDLQPHAV